MGFSCTGPGSPKGIRKILEMFQLSSLFMYNYRPIFFTFTVAVVDVLMTVRIAMSWISVCINVILTLRVRLNLDHRLVMIR